MRSRILFGGILMSVVLAACDDSSAPKKIDVNPVYKPEDIGQECNLIKPCPSGLECHENTCVLIVSEDQECDESHQCEAPLECVDGACQDMQGREEEKQPECDENKACSQEKYCDGGKCKMKGLRGEKCASTEQCLEGVCENGVCSVYVGEYARCDAEQGWLCEAGMECAENHRCYSVPTLGAYCVPEIQSCEAGYECDFRFEKCMIQGELGDECNYEENFSCKTGLDCIEGKCRGHVQNECSELELCESESAVCYGGKCIETHECEVDNDCHADTYCCTDSECLVKNVCIPYGEGPRGIVDEDCTYTTAAGVFEADVQCEWAKPDKDDPYPNHANVLMTPLVMNTPHDSKGSNEIIFTTYNCNDGGDPSGSGGDINCYGVIRIINAETCKLHESIFDDYNHVIGGSNLAMADVDGDTFVEIFAARGRVQKTLPDGSENTQYGVVAFHWDKIQQKYVTWWKNDIGNANAYWGGISVHDIDNDGVPEVLNRGEVYNALTGERINKSQTNAGSIERLPTVGDLEGDGNIEAIGGNVIYRWNSETKVWDTAYSNVPVGQAHKAYADFGTPIKDENGTVTGYDLENLDGIAEVVACGGGVVQISSLTGYKILSLSGLGGGGPCTVGDFDNDGLPELATAFGDWYRIFDPRCLTAADGCETKYIRWAQPSQDHSSSSTGSSLFDFDGDGAMEAVYADECYTRIYNGTTGTVLFSTKHSSATWHEYPVIADVDNDESAEIVVGSNNSVSCPGTYDAIHPGIKCSEDLDCKSRRCVNNFCRCDPESAEDQCNTRRDENDETKLLEEYLCVPPLDATDQDGHVCRAKNKKSGERMTGVRVMRDRLDRWTSSRNIWNQHVYTINNINDDQTIPKTKDWVQNFTPVDPSGTRLNNFRQNVQGALGRNVAPDITGKLDKDNLCVISGENEITLHGVVCNRGTKMVASRMPASFYRVNPDGSLGEKYCTSYTVSNVSVGGCLPVSCLMKGSDLGYVTVRMISNDDGEGGRTTVECNPNNNTDEVTISGCAAN